VTAGASPSRENIFQNCADGGVFPLLHFGDLVILCPMSEPREIPNDLKACQALVRAQAASLSQQAATIASQAQQFEELTVEMEKIRKLLSHFLNGHRSEKRILPATEQAWLPFDSSEEFQAARAEAEAQAEAIIQTYTVTRIVTKKKRDESLPSHLPRVEKVIEGNDTQKNCPAHGERKVIGYDKTETLVYKRPELYVLVKKYPKYACRAIPPAAWLRRNVRPRWSKAIVMTPAWRRRWSRPSGSTTCRSTGTRTCSPAAAGHPAAQRC